MENNKRQELWEQIQQYYLDKFGIGATSVDLMADIDVLRLCATGSSTDSIVNFLGMEYEAVREIISKHIGFAGWNEDLRLNPYKFYKELTICTEDDYREIVFQMNENYTHLEIDLMYRMSVIVAELERLLDENWV